MSEAVLTVQDVGKVAIEALLGRMDLSLAIIATDGTIPGSFWGEREAGVIGTTVYVRPDTPVHSLLHETCHVVCMDSARRAVLHTNAGGDDLEEAAVCYLQILMADALDGVGRGRLMLDMDRWGYSFRMGSTQRWFEEDADDAREWLERHALIDVEGAPSFRLRT